MRFLFIAVLSLAAWLGPASASAEQVQSPLVVTAVSLWARPAAPGSTLDPSDPHVMGLAGSILGFTLVSSGDQYTSQILDSYYTDVIESLPGETGTIEEVVVPQYGQGCSAATVIGEGLRFDVIASYDGIFSYALVAIAAATSPSEMSVLTGIADQMFAPTRPEYLTGTMQLFQEEFEPGGALTNSESLLTRLPQPSEIPAEYQLLGQEVFIS